MQSPLHFVFFKKEYLSVLLFCLLIGGFLMFSNRSADTIKKPDDKALPFNSAGIESAKIVLTEFDPNELTKEQWLQLGFSERQTATILKYKDVVGGQFVSKEQFKKCYAVSNEKYQELSPYILLPEKKESSRFSYFSKPFQKSNRYVKKELKIPGTFNPDLYTLKNWMNMGFTERQAAAILKYKSYLGGSFLSKEKLRECFIISPENYTKLEPYLLLPEKTPENFQPYQKQQTNSPEKAKIIYQAFDPNLIDVEDWMKLGFSEKQASVIINYKNKKLKGKFTHLDEIQNCFVISQEKFEEMKPYIRLATSEVEKPITKGVEKSVEKSDFTKIDLNEISLQQLLEFGFDEYTSKSFIDFRNRLGGFVNESQVYEVRNISRELAEKLVHISPLKSEKIKKYSLVDAPESWLKTHPYFRYYADKIIYYRITYPDDKKILKKINAKAEVEMKMKWYLTL